VGFETGPFQIPTQPRPRKTKLAGQRPSPAASPAPPPAWIYGRRGCRQTPRRQLAISFSRAPPARNPNPSFLSRRAPAQSLLSAVTATAVSPLVHLLHLRSPLSASPSPLRRLRGRVLLVPLSLRLSHSHGNARSRHLGACAPARRVLHSSVLPLSTPPVLHSSLPQRRK
jgi:hypothetical protein